MLSDTKVKNEKWDWDYFLSERERVLSLWPTGEQLKRPTALEEAVAYHRGQPWWKYASLRNERAETEGRIQIVPMVGHALVEQTVHHIQHSEDLAPDRWYVITDTYTRKSQYSKAQEAVDRSKKDGFSYLNGYPLVAHGVEGARAINESTRAAIGSDNNDEDARLPAELAFAGGWTFGTIKAIEQLIQHSRDYPVDQNIHNCQYIDRLAGYYTEQGVPILRRASANLPGWDSLGFKVTVALLETLLSAAQGVKYIDLSIGIGMNLIQDAAAIHVLKKLAREFLSRMGCADVKVYSWTFFYLGDWPRDHGQMSGQLAWNAAVSALAGSNGMFIKSPDEATTTPTAAAFREAIHICGQVARIVAGQRLDASEELCVERDMIEKEVRAVMARILELGEGDIVKGSCQAMLNGVLDTMFSPYKYLQSRVKIVRDRNGALRYLDPGLVPLPKEVKEFHRQKIAERESKEGIKANVNWIIRDATWASRPLMEEKAERPYWPVVRGIDSGAHTRNFVIKKQYMNSQINPETGVTAVKKDRRQPIVILGTVGYDAHIVGSSMLKFAFEEAGFKVIFLGAMVSPEEFISAAKETAADAILVSSLYGMGRIDCADFRAKCVEAGLDEIRLYIGGILVTDPEAWPETERLFKDYGFDRVYPPETKPETAIAHLKIDLGLAN